MSNTIGYVPAKTGVSGTQHVYEDSHLAADVMLSSATYADGDLPIQTGADTGTYVTRGINVESNGRMYLPEGMRFNTSPVTPSHVAGLWFWDAANDCPAYYNSEADVTHQMGQEIWIRVYNNTGSKLSNGKVCYLSTFFSGFPTAVLANASAAATCLATIGVATHDIEDGTYGFLTRIGTVRGLNTSGCTSGSILWLSESSDGDYTETKPSSPNYAISIGNCGAVDAVNGSIEVRVTVGNNTGDVIGVFNGSILEDHTTTVTSNGSTITLSLEKTGGGDLSLFFNGAFEELDTTPAATVSLTAGTDTVPVLNYIYIPESTMTLTASTTDFDWTSQIVPIATVLCQSASTLQTDGPLKHHAWTDHVTSSNDQGHITHVNRWIRSQNATWLSGAAVTATGGAATFDISTTAGKMLQLHEHPIDVFNTASGSYIYVVNDPVTAYNKVGDLTTSLTDSASGPLTNRYYSVVIWVAGNEGSGQDKLYCNLPAGSYNSESGASTDSLGYTNYSIPSQFKGVGVLLARVNVRNQSGAAGTFTINSTVDLRGLVPSTSAGGATGTGGAENFVDLLDVPSSYSGQALKTVRVNAGETALEFATAGGSSPLTTKGDLYGYDTGDNRLPVGTNDQVLTADSTEALGIKWADPAFSDPMVARGDMIIRNASNVTSRLAVGSANQVLSSDGTDISWTTKSSGMSYSVITSNTNAVADGGYIIDASSGTVTLTLPATPSAGDLVGVKVIDKTNTVTVARNGSNIEGSATNWVASANFTGFVLGYSDATVGWTVLTQVVYPTDITTLTDAATIAVDLDDGDDFKVTLGGNRILGNPTNATVGQTGEIYVYQDATGSRTLSYASNWVLPGGTAHTLTTDANAEDVLSYKVETATRIHIVLSSPDAS